jgi:outer membrane biosynthesis protein TonB
VFFAKENEPRALMTKPVFIALLISVAIHLGFVGIWQLAERVPWIKTLPPIKTLSAAEEFLMPKIPTPRPAPTPKAPELVFIEVDPAQAIKEAPKDTKFYSAVSTEAANPKPDKKSDAPKIEGVERTRPKVTENAKPKAKPLQPVPPQETEPDSNETAEEKPKAKQEKPGDLAFAKPQEKSGSDHGKNGEAEQAKRPRPRTIAEAKQAGSPGQKTKQEGGVHKINLSGSVAARGTPLGNYDWELVQAVQQKWDSLLERATILKPGHVIVEFRLHYDGRVTDVRVAESTVGNLQSLYCEMAIQEPSPYRKWPIELRRELKGDTREVRFTFYYE